MRELSHAFTVCGLFAVAERMELAGTAAAEGTAFVFAGAAITANGVSVEDDLMVRAH